MSGSTTNLDLISPSQASKEVTANALFDAASVSTFLGRRASTSTALTWGYYGGVCMVAGVPTAKANGTLTLTANLTNYIEYAAATGVVAVNTTAYASDALWFAALATANKTPLYKIVAGASTVTSYVDWRFQGIGAPIAQFPVQYMGTWNASTNTPTLAGGTGMKGSMYVTSVEGTQNLGGGSRLYTVADMVVYNGATWDVIQGGISSAEVITALGFTPIGPNLAGDITSVGNTTTLTNAPVIAKVLTGFVSGAGTVAATDSILASIQKLDGNVTLREVASNKSDDIALTADSATLYPTQHAAKAYVDNKLVSAILPAISSVLPPITIVDVAYFDNSKDPSWLDKCSHTSWYNETRATGKQLGSYASAIDAVAAGAAIGDVYYNTTSAAFERVASSTTSTATFRGGSQKFPMKGFVTAEANRVVIWDTTHGVPAMWMVFDISSNPTSKMIGTNAATVSSIAILGRTLVVGTALRLHAIDFVADTGTRYGAGTSDALGTFRGGQIVNRNAVAGYTLINPAPQIANNAVNSVALVYLPDAPLDSNGMRIPTIYAFTAGGVSRIASDGSVSSTASTDVYYGFIHGDYVGALYVNLQMWPLDSALPTGGAGALGAYWPSSAVAGGWNATRVPFPTGFGISSFRAGSINGLIAIANAGGLILHKRNPAIGGSALLAAVSSVFNTGWMVGDIRRAICYTSSLVLTDRSIKAVAPTEVGTLTKTVAAGGRVSISGFSAADYIQEASHADWNALGAGDFSIIMTGVTWGTLATLKTLFSLGNGTSAGSFVLEHLAANTVSFSVWNATPTKTAICTSAVSLSDTAEHTLEVSRSTVNGVANTVQIKVDGIVAASAVSALTISNATGFLRIGEGQAASAPWTGGSLTGFKISATAPTAEQSEFIAATENELNNGAPCLLSSSSSASSLVSSDKTGLVYAVNGSNIDVFHNLKRVDYAPLATGVTASGVPFPDRILLMTGTTNTCVAPEEDVNSELTMLNMQLAEAKQGAEPYQFTSSGTTQKMPKGFKAVGWMFNSTDGANLVVAQTFDGFCWTLTGLTTAKVYNAMIRRV